MSLNTDFYYLSNAIYAAMIRKILFRGILILVKHAIDLTISLKTGHIHALTK